MMLTCATHDDKQRAFRLGNGASQRRGHIWPRLALAALLTLTITACNAQKPDQKPDLKGALEAPASRTAPFSEPAVTAKIIDAVTGQPLAGVMVYGFYATSGGGTLAGGSKFGQHVKSFETATDANGVFRLEAWDTGNRTINGQRGNKFPLLAFYKPGYDLWYDHLSSITDYRPKSGIAGTQVEIRDGVRDWTKYPHRMAPLSSERDRYSALEDSGVAMMFEGACGWEAYARTLLVQHDEWKEILRMSFPPEELRADGYSKGRFNHPNLQLRAAQTQISEVDRLLKQRQMTTGASRCRDPEILFSSKK